MTDRAGSGTAPAAALAALTLIWGYNWVVMKVALVDSPPLTFAALRSGFSAVALFVVLLLLRMPLAPTRGRELFYLGMLQTAGFVGMVSIGLDEGAAGKSAVLAYTMPFWTLLMARFMLEERVRGLQWLAVALAGAGLIAVLSPWDAELGVRDSLWALGGAFSWAAGNIVVKRMALQSDELLSVSAWQMAIGTLGLAALALALDTEPVRWTASFSLALGYNVVFATALAWLLWLFALSRLSAVAAGLAALGTPVVSLFAAWLQLGELPTRAEALGMTSILAALAVLSVAGWLRVTRAPTGA